MDIFDKFFTKFAYKFPKGYPDMDNPSDVALLESLISETTNFKFKLTEVTALTKRELEKDATFRGGIKEPRVNILLKKIKNDEPLTLVEGSEFRVDNKEEVIQALGNPIPAKGIELKDKEGNVITNSKLAKTDEYGGVGGRRGGSDVTKAAENAQCIANAIRYSKGGDITPEDITEENIESSKNDVDGDGKES